MGLGSELTALGALAHFPAVVTDPITIDGEIRKLPLGVHIDGMVYCIMEVATKPDLDPAAWDRLDAIFADFDKTQAAGIAPLAISVPQWQFGCLFHALTANVAGLEVCNVLYGPAPLRDDVPVENLETSDKPVKDLLRVPRRLVFSPSITVDADGSNAIWTLIFNLWSDPAMSVDDAVALLKSESAAIFDRAATLPRQSCRRAAPYGPPAPNTKRFHGHPPS